MQFKYDLASLVIAVGVAATVFVVLWSVIEFLSQS